MFLWNGEFVVTLHYKVGKEFVNAAQNVGDAAAIAGYALTLSVAGAEVGVPLAGIGNTISGAAGITGMLIDAVNGDWADVLKSGFLYLLTKQQENYFINICLVMTKNRWRRFWLRDWNIRSKSPT